MTLHDARPQGLAVDAVGDRLRRRLRGRRDGYRGVGLRRGARPPRTRPGRCTGLRVALGRGDPVLGQARCLVSELHRRHRVGLRRRDHDTEPRRCVGVAKPTGLAFDSSGGPSGRFRPRPRGLRLRGTSSDPDTRRRSPVTVTAGNRRRPGDGTSCT